MNDTTRTSRRRFLKTTAVAAGFPLIVPSSALGADGHTAPSNRIVMGAIGVGPQGNGVLGGFLNRKDAQVVAICDVKTPVRQSVRDRVDAHYATTGCAAYHDFRDLLSRDDIDAVSIATPDHWHVLAALAATRAGKHVYVEKPMGLSIAEDQALRTAVHRQGTAFQFGTQQRSSAHFRLACELARNERIGKLHTINVWSPPSASGGPTAPVPVPDWLDYDLWLGPAPRVPYTQDRCSNRYWWFNSDYALGFIAGWGVHPLDIALWGGGDLVQTPVRVDGTGTFPRVGMCDTATDWRVTFDYDSGVRMDYAAWPAPPEWCERYGPVTSHGTAFEGTEGWVHVDRSGIKAHPASLLETTAGPGDTRLCVSTHHQGNLLDCIRSGAPTVCPIDDAVQADIMCQLSDIAIRLERPLHWNSATECFADDVEANRTLTRSMRSPWRL